jgi:hypothetical protein
MLDSRISTPILITSRHVFSGRPRNKKKIFLNFLRKPMFKKPTKYLTVPKHAQFQSLLDAV